VIPRRADNRRHRKRAVHFSYQPARATKSAADPFSKTAAIRAVASKQPAS
jgi:hypothetical protein